MHESLSLSKIQERHGAFEVFHDGSWNGVDYISLRNGKFSVEIKNPQKIELANIHKDLLRFQSRRATSFDCATFLRQGIDVCVLIPNPTISCPSSQIQSHSLAWIDARIIKVQRHQHDDDVCKCAFLVSPYSREGPMRKRKQMTELEMTVKINQISILQNVIHKPDENGIFSASSTENCNSIFKTKLKTKTFASEIAWLVVFSCLRGVDFEIKVVQNKVVNHIVNDKGTPSGSTNNMKIVCFKDSNGILKPRVEIISLEITPIEETKHLVENLNIENSFEQINIRRSKRNKVKPDKFSSYSSPDFGRFHYRPSAKHRKSSSKKKTIKRESFSLEDNETYMPSEKNDTEIKIESESETSEPSEEIGAGGKREKGNGKKGNKRKKVFSKKKQEFEYDEVTESLIRNIKFYLGRKAKRDGGRKEKVVCEQPTPGYYPETADFTWSSPCSDSEIENSEEDEYEEHWNQMNLCLTEIAVEEEKKNLNSQFRKETTVGEGSCVHDCELDEQIGLICKLCGVVCTDIRDILPPFAKEGGHGISKEKPCPIITDPSRMNSCSFTKLPDEISQGKPYKNIWASIPRLEPKLHPHQRNAFEFIWQNLAGTTILEHINPKDTNRGGCVISHSPGSGKTLTVISFLTSYLSIFPDSCPLVLTPKSAVHTWKKEFEKWDSEIPVYTLQGISKIRKTRFVKSLNMVESWHEKPSVLLMTYPSFLSLTKENKKDNYSKCISDALLNNPGLLVLDEGHNPRNTSSKLRKLLMKVKTESRILLSGTVFQNNFEQYFNTLCLARPRFVQDFVNELDPHKKIKKNVKYEEKKARNLFVEKIGQMIESINEKDRKQGIDLLTKITFKFIDVFDGENLKSLPGLETYTIFLKSTEPQERVLNKLQTSFKPNTRCHFETEFLISIGSIHPWLVRTSKCSNNIFTAEELEELDKLEMSFWSGSKTHFVVDIIVKSLDKKEKVLIFCHNLAPLTLLVKLIEYFFGWSRGEEILLLSGEQDLTTRSETIDKFNGDKEGKRKVLLASTNACAEGINLTAASRLVLLDSEWNHSKTRQAIARARRLGQERTVYAYLLLARDPWEQKKYESNAKKAWMSKMVISGKCVEDQTKEKVDEGEIGDEFLREIVQEDAKRTVEMVVKH